MQFGTGQAREAFGGRGVGVGVALLMALACAPLPAPAPAPTYWPGTPPATAPRAARAARPASHAASADRTLPSGLHLVLDEDPDATAAGVVSVIRGGSEEDPPGEEGLAHLVEHLTYRAVDPSAAGERSLSRWDRLTKDATVEMNGHTTPDCLLFYEVGPPARLAALLGLEAARLAAPLVGVDEAAFALERRIIGSEHLVRADPRSPGWAAMLLWPSLFPAGHPYARPTGGTEESRRNLTLADARAYASRVFRAERTTLLVTAPPGAISLQAIIDSLPAALREKDPRAPAPAAAAVAAPAPAVVAASAAAGPAPAPADAAPLRLDRRGSPLPRPELWLGWALPGNFGESALTEEVLERWVDNDLQSKDLLREERHIQQTVTLLHPGRQASALFIRVLLADGADADRVAQVVVARVASLWARETTAQETFFQLRTFADTQRLLDEPGQLPRALERAMRAALGPPPPPGAASAANSGSLLTASTLARFAYQWLTRAEVHATLFTPAPPARRPGASAEAPIAARALGAGTAAPNEIVPGAAAWSADELRRLVPAAPAAAVKTLASGLTVITVRRPGAAAVAWLGFRGGTADADPPLLAEMATHARPEARQAIRMHVLPGRGVTKDLSFDTVEFAPAQLSAALTILFAKATSPLNDWPDREGLERLVSPLAAAEDRPTKTAEQAFWRALFGDHPYGRVVRADDLDKLTRSDVEGWMGRVDNVHNAALVVIGDVSAAEVEREAQILSRQMKSASWVASPPAPAPPAARPPAGQRLQPVVTARPGALTDLRLGCLLPPLAAADRGAYELLARGIEARLNVALRLDQGDGYGVHVGYERLRGGTTYLVASTYLAEDGVATALAALRRQWERWERAGLDAGELNVARWRYAGSFSSATANTYELAFQLLDDWSAEPAALGKVRLRPDVAAVDAGRVNELFATCKANAVLGLTGNEPLIRRALTQAWPTLAAASK
jgi:zinc protease